MILFELVGADIPSSNVQFRKLLKETLKIIKNKITLVRYLNMAIIECPKHGMKGVGHVCLHILKAVEANQKIEMSSVKDDFYGEIFFCE